MIDEKRLKELQTTNMGFSNKRLEEIKKALKGVVQNLGDIVDEGDTEEVFPKRKDRWIWSQVYSSLESGEYGDWTPFNGKDFPPNTRPLIEDEDLENLTEILGEERTNDVLGIIIPSWGAFLIREVKNKELLSLALTEDGLKTLQRNFVIELWNNIAPQGLITVD